MDTTKSKNLHLLHIILGIFFIFSGIFTLFEKKFFYSVWIISLGLFFLVDFLKIILKSKIKASYLTIMHYALALIVLVTGIFSLLS
jgi:hypothetical protein